MTPEQLLKLNILKDFREWSEVLNDLLPKYQIDSPQRTAAFLAQTIHESAHFTALKENLNYGAKGLVMTWPKRFTTPELVNKYTRQPEQIANYVYANRLGNGDEASGDGWKYCGRGLIQLTGKSNYQAFADSIEMNLEDVPNYLETKKGAVEAACWFWKENNLNKWVDANDFDGLSDVINRGRKTTQIGDAIGYSDRLDQYKKALNILGS
jgi:putative chitinase